MLLFKILDDFINNKILKTNVIEKNKKNLKKNCMKYLFFRKEEREKEKK